jgi:hypothetical protein
MRRGHRRLIQHCPRATSIGFDSVSSPILPAEVANNFLHEFPGQTPGVRVVSRPLSRLHRPPLSRRRVASLTSMAQKQRLGSPRAFS